MKNNELGAAFIPGYELAQSLGKRHITMIGIGGIIGAGLYVGSGNAISLAGPAALIAFTLAGFLVLCVCQILGELASSWKGKGSFARFGALAFGATAGEIIGWLYLWFWIQNIIAEAVVGGKVLAQFLPARQWVWTLVLLAGLCLVNLISARLYGESEFLLSSLKIISILVFIMIGILAICGVFSHGPHGISHLWSEGVFPEGISGMDAAFLLAVTFYSGAESTSLIAAESDNPIQNLKRTLRAIMWRVLVFYVGTIFVAVALVPYTAFTSRGTFSTVLNRIGIHHADTIVNTIILVAVVSCLNSSYFIASRMLYNLASTGSASRLFARVNSRSVPQNAILLCGIIGLFGVLASYYFPNKVYVDLLSSQGATMLMIYAVVALAQVKLRKTVVENQGLTIKMWLHPWISSLVAVVIIFCLAWMLTLDSQRIPVVIAVIAAIIFAACLFIKNRVANKKSVLAKV